MSDNARTMRLHPVCPFCKKRLYGYRTEQQTETQTEVSYQCRNALCSARILAYLTLDRVLQLPVVQVNQVPSLKLSPVLKAQLEKASALMPVADAPQDQKIIDEAISRGDLFDQLLVNQNMTQNTAQETIKTIAINHSPPLANVAPRQRGKAQT